MSVILDQTRPETDAIHLNRSAESGDAPRAVDVSPSGR